MSKRKKGGRHGSQRKAGRVAEQEAEATAAEERYAEMRSRDKTPRQIRAVAVARGDDWLIKLCDAIIAGTREEPTLTPPEDVESSDDDTTDTDATDEAVSGAGDTEEPEPESSPEECRYIELRGQGKTQRQIRALAESRNDHDLYEYSDAIIRGAREEPEGEYPDAEEGEGGGNEEVGDDAEVAESDADAADADGTEDGGNAEDVQDADGGDTPAETDARLVVTLEELRSIDLELTGLINRFREAAGEMNHLRGVLSELQRTRKAMGPAARAPRLAREPGAPRGISLIAAAANLLAENGLTMNCVQIVRELDEKGVWRSPGGKTPQATLYAAIGTEITAKGDQSRFVRKDKGLFAASEYGIALFQAAQSDAATANAEPES